MIRVIQDYLVKKRKICLSIQGSSLSTKKHPRLGNNDKARTSARAWTRISWCALWPPGPWAFEQKCNNNYNRLLATQTFLTRKENSALQPRQCDTSLSSIHLSSAFNLISCSMSSAFCHNSAFSLKSTSNYSSVQVRKLLITCHFTFKLAQNSF